VFPVDPNNVAASAKLVTQTVAAAAQQMSVAPSLSAFVVNSLSAGARLYLKQNLILPTDI